MNDSEKKDIVKNTYDEIANEYHEEFKNYTIDNASIDKFLSLLKDNYILDAGCGGGIDCKYVYSKGFKVTGIDFSNKLLDIARKENNNIDYINMDITNLSFPNHFFSGIISKYSLHHISKSEVKKVLDEFNRVLNHGGKLLIIVRDGNGEKIIDETFKKDLKNFVNYMKKEELIELLNNSNFKIISIDEQKDSNNFAFGNTKLVIISEKE